MEVGAGLVWPRPLFAIFRCLAPLPVIIRPRPHWFLLLFARRGTLVHRIYSQQLFLFVLSCLVVRAHGDIFFWKVPLTATPFSLMGICFAIFMGFRINASYDRFWEARKHWGSVLVETRNLARLALSGVGDAQPVRPFVLGLAGFAASMRNQLRNLPADHALQQRLPPELLARLGAVRSAPTQILLWLSQWLQQARQRHSLEPTLVQTMEQGLNNLSFAIGSCERIANTPIPFAYSVVLHRSVYVFCIMLPFGLVDSVGIMTPLVVTFISYTFLALEALSDEIEQPFGLENNDLALNAMVEAIDANLCEMLGDTVPPAPGPGANFVLT